MPNNPQSGAVGWSGVCDCDILGSYSLFHCKLCIFSTSDIFKKRINNYAIKVIMISRKLVSSFHAYSDRTVERHTT